jgi:hypothetical protein
LRRRPPGQRPRQHLVHERTHSLDRRHHHTGDRPMPTT